MDARGFSPLCARPGSTVCGVVRIVERAFGGPGIWQGRWMGAEKCHRLGRQDPMASVWAPSSGCIARCRRSTREHAMSTLFAFLHHLCAFTLVSAVAVEFVLIRGDLTLSSARRLQIADMVLGIAAGALLIVGLSRVF